jgi:formate C-acetyltransferase
MSGKKMSVIDYNVASFDEFMSAYLSEVDKLFDFAIDFAEKQSQYNILMNPSPIYSSSFDACIEKGRDVHEYSVKYNNMSLKYFGLATVVDSLAAIKKLVFDSKQITLSELSKILANNWEGCEGLRIKIMNDKDKYGNGRALPDDIMTKITSHLEERYTAKSVKNGKKIRLGLDSIDTYLYRGEKTAATPDGRLNGQAVSRNLCSSTGMDRAGITGYMSSVLKINSAAFLNSAIFDFVLHPSAVEGNKGLCDFVSLARIFFDHGGFAMQGNIVNKETLLKAQNYPEKHSTLQIRVCGWNEYFVRMSKAKQDYFINSAEE